jgi:hypothetical protein
MEALIAQGDQSGFPYIALSGGAFRAFAGAMAVCGAGALALVRFAQQAA